MSDLHVDMFVSRDSTDNFKRIQKMGCDIHQYAEYRSILGNWIQSFGPNPEGVSDEDRRVVFFFDN